MGRGSCFEVLLRLEQVAPGSFAPSSELAHVRVLVADPHPAVRAALVEPLRAMGARVEEASAGDAAVRRLLEGASGDPFRVAVIDLQMRDDRGAAIAARVRAESALAALGLVLLASPNARGDAERARVDRAAAVVTKPVRLSPFLLALRSVLRSGSPEAGVQLSAAAPATQPLAGMRVLLAEDNPVNQKVGRKLLERLGCVVATALNGVEVLAALEQGSYDAVLMDCQMPELDGYEATRAIRSREAGSGDVARMPIIAMTANAMAGDRDACLAAGMDDYLSKPVRPNELMRALTRWRSSAAAPIESLAPAPAPAI
jgi:CheY-like chemotaxis protein